MEAVKQVNPVLQEKPKFINFNGTVQMPFDINIKGDAHVGLSWFAYIIINDDDTFKVQFRIYRQQQNTYQITDLTAASMQFINDSLPILSSTPNIEVLNYILSLPRKKITIPNADYVDATAKGCLTDSFNYWYKTNIPMEELPALTELLTNGRPLRNILTKDDGVFGLEATIIKASKEELGELEDFGNLEEKLKNLDK